MMVTENLNLQMLTFISLPRTLFSGKSDPFIEFHRQMIDGSFALAHRTEFIKNTLNPIWKPMKINTRRLCDNNPDTIIKVICWVERLEWQSACLAYTCQRSRV